LMMYCTATNGFSQLDILLHQSTVVSPFDRWHIPQVDYKLELVQHSITKGNFGGNQLLDGSISLSPLYPNLTIDLHVRTATSLHQSFLWLHPIQA